MPGLPMAQQFWDVRSLRGLLRSVARADMLAVAHKRARFGLPALPPLLKGGGGSAKDTINNNPNASVKAAGGGILGKAASWGKAGVGAGGGNKVAPFPGKDAAAVVAEPSKAKAVGEGRVWPILALQAAADDEGGAHQAGTSKAGSVVVNVGRGSAKDQAQAAAAAAAVVQKQGPGAVAEGMIRTAAARTSKAASVDQSKQTAEKGKGKEEGPGKLFHVTSTSKRPKGKYDAPSVVELVTRGVGLKELVLNEVGVVLVAERLYNMQYKDIVLKLHPVRDRPPGDDEYDSDSDISMDADEEDKDLVHAKSMHQAYTEHMETLHVSLNSK